LIEGSASQTGEKGFTTEDTEESLQNKLNIRQRLIPRSHGRARSA